MDEDRPAEADILVALPSLLLSSTIRSSSSLFPSSLLFMFDDSSLPSAFSLRVLRLPSPGLPSSSSSSSSSPLALSLPASQSLTHVGESFRACVAIALNPHNLPIPSPAAISLLVELISPASPPSPASLAFDFSLSPGNFHEEMIQFPLFHTGLHSLSVTVRVSDRQFVKTFKFPVSSAFSLEALASLRGEEILIETEITSAAQKNMKINKFALDRIIIGEKTLSFSDENCPGSPAFILASSESRSAAFRVKMPDLPEPLSSPLQFTAIFQLSWRSSMGDPGSLEMPVTMRLGNPVGQITTQIPLRVLRIISCPSSVVIEQPFPVEFEFFCPDALFARVFLSRDRLGAIFPFGKSAVALGPGRSRFSLNFVVVGLGLQRFSGIFIEIKMAGSAEIFSVDGSAELSKIIRGKEKKKIEREKENTIGG